jgi:hypothetical protein
VNNQILGFRVCKNFEVLASKQNKNMHLSLNWQRYLITYNEIAKANHQRSLGRKSNSDSESQCMVMAIEKQAKDTYVEKNVKLMHKMHLKSHIVYFALLIRMQRNRDQFMIYLMTLTCKYGKKIAENSHKQRQDICADR